MERETVDRESVLAIQSFATSGRMSFSQLLCGQFSPGAVQGTLPQLCGISLNYGEQRVGGCASRVRLL
jgi:hypothetical protein